MTPTADTPRKPDYGLDAPAVVRNLLVVGGAGLLLGVGILAGMVPGALHWTGGDGGQLTIGLLGPFLGPGIACTTTGLAMLWNSRIGKVRHRDALLDKLRWSGDEHVVDVGCGRGLMLIGAAAHLTTGRATGIDIWRSEDLSGNSPTATLANARAAGVADRVVVETADMRSLPFAAGSIDRVVSCAAIHNLADRVDRAAAIREIARVLKPRGEALIDDIRYFGEYRDAFAANGCQLIARMDNRFVSTLWTVLSFGSLRPGILLVQKAA